MYKAYPDWINAAFEYMNQDKLDENKEVIDQDYLKSTKGTLKLKKKENVLLKIFY